jgi:hypothetical protein
VTPQVACGRCGTVNWQGAAVCSNCGARLIAEPSSAGAPAVGPPPPPPPPRVDAAHPWERTANTRVAAWLVVGLIGIAAVCVLGVVFWLAGQPPPGCNDPICPPVPPVSPPLAAADPYSSTQYGYSLDASPLNPKCGRATERSSTSIKWTVNGWPIEVRGEEANGRSADHVVNDAAAHYANATLVYEIPMAEIGSHAGYGAVYALNVDAGNAAPVPARAIVMAAVDGNLTILLDSLGPWIKPDPTTHPNPAQTWTPGCFSATLTSLSWPGEEPR